MQFSVLISTYKNDDSICLKKALESIFNQSFLPTQVVLIIDGEITQDAVQVISDFKGEYSEIFDLVQLPQNVGLGNALNIGIKHCKHSLIARMDADDVSDFNRFKTQIDYFNKNPNVSVVGSFVEEFHNEPNDYGSIKKVPLSNEEIKKYSSFRNPINHPSVMFKKEAIEQVGSYKEINLFEDYYLWLRLLKAGFAIENIPKCLLHFKVGNDLIGRRHGFSYLQKEYVFLKLCYSERLISASAFVTQFFSRLPLRILPKKVLLFIYNKFLRHSSNLVYEGHQKRILFVTTKSGVGGVQKFVKEQIDISSKEFDVYLCCNQDGWLSQQSADKLKGHYFSSSIEKKTSILFLIQLIKFIKHHKIDLVITNSANAGFYGRLATFFAKINSCYFSHGWSSVYNGGKLSFVLNFIEKILAFISNKVICVSDNDFKIARDKISISTRKLVVLKNATLPIFKQKITPQNQPLKIIALARFANPKRIDLMIKSFEQINDAELSIAGSGPDFEIWKQYVQEKKITNVNLLGEIQSFAAFNEYDAFMLISNSEGLPISAIEAMSAGLPLILSNVGGCPELIYNNGILVENNIESIVDAVDKIKENYIQYQANSTELYNSTFNLNNVKSNYINLYKSMIN
jgi:glycosyltransferase involved in cell wall biosynthesis